MDVSVGSSEGVCLTCSRALAELNCWWQALHLQEAVVVLVTASDVKA